MINNKQQLLKERTCSEARKIVLDTLESALKAASPETAISNYVEVKGNILKVLNTQMDLNKYRSIHIIGAGKASYRMAIALNSILENRITDGLIIMPEIPNGEHTIGLIQLWIGTHPIPSQKGVAGVRKMLNLVQGVGKDDLVICILSGGGSALMPMPYGDITLRDKKAITNSLLKSGATIQEINCVRKHLSAIKGGRLAERLKEATTISLIISDVVGDTLDTIASGPLAPDNTSFQDVRDILMNYNLWESLRGNIKGVIQKGLRGDIPETPKPGNLIFGNVTNNIIANNLIACEAAKDFLVNKNINANILTSHLQGESKEVGKVLSAIAKELYYNANNRPSAFILGGETTVKVTGEGRGGRNQELILSACRGINGLKNTVLASIGTDGIDGNSNAAGAIADTNTLARAQDLNLIPDTYLINNDSNSFFSKLNDTIETGLTGTNVNDISILLCL